MREAWARLSPSEKVRVGIFTLLCLLCLIGVMVFVGQRETLPTMIGAIGIGLAVALPRIKRYNQEQAEREANKDATHDSGRGRR
jgi:predicted RND superfamily exporter protein